MNHFNFSIRNLQGQEKRLQRILEMIPGLSSWSILLGMILLSFVKPIVAAVIIIAFNFFWLLRLLYMTAFLVISYIRLKSEDKTVWLNRVKGLDHLNDNLSEQKIPDKSNFTQWISSRIHRNEILTLKQKGITPPLTTDVYHVVLFPVIKENREIIETSLKGLQEQLFPTTQMLVVLALEDRAKPEVKQNIFKLAEEYKKYFWDLLVITHPADLPQEARVKGANVTYAAKQVSQYLSEKKIPFENVIISCFDADTVVSPQYFACLTYYFMVTPNRIQASFQPIPMYHNNIWQVPGFARVIETGSSFFQLIEATNPEKLVTFSSHSMSFKALVEVGYWPVDMISDDSAIYWKAYIHYDGNYRVIPLPVTLSMDVVSAEGFWKTVRSVYRQKRRWAWGVENFPIILRAFLKSDKISLYDRVRLSFKLFEGHVSWATWGFLLTFIGWLPLIFGRGEFANSVIYYNAPRITNTIFHLASLSLLTSILLSLALLPKDPTRHRLSQKIGHALEWLLIPFILLFLSALPALDAQTRLMLGRYMEFWVSDKRRKKFKK